MTHSGNAREKEAISLSGHLKRLGRTFVLGQDDQLAGQRTGDLQEVTPGFLAATAPILALLWGLDLFVLQTPILTPFAEGGAGA